MTETSRRIPQPAGSHRPHLQALQLGVGTPASVVDRNLTQEVGGHPHLLVYRDPQSMNARKLNTHLKQTKHILI